MDQQDLTQPILTRRAALQLGAGTAGALAIGGAGIVTATSAAATVPTSQRFDLSQPSYDLFRSKLLHESHHAMQGFAFDNVNRRLFVVQAQNGTSGDDLCVTQLSFAGAILGHMHLGHAGHGVSIGVEAVGTASYIWMECDANGTTDAARGTALARFKFVNGATPSVTKFLTGSDTITCATDPINKRIMVRRKENGAFWLSVYALVGTSTNFGAPLVHIKQPAMDGVFQGYTIYGSYAYFLHGTGQTDPAESKINSYVTSVNLNSGAVVQHSLTKAGTSLIYREPEGMGVYRTSGGATRLFLGFASRSSLDNINRYANIFYKDVLV